MSVPEPFKKIAHVVGVVDMLHDSLRRRLPPTLWEKGVENHLQEAQISVGYALKAGALEIEWKLHLEQGPNGSCGIGVTLQESKAKDATESLLRKVGGGTDAIARTLMDMIGGRERLILSYTGSGHASMRTGVLFPANQRFQEPLCIEIARLLEKGEKSPMETFFSIANMMAESISAEERS
ncbi:MAG: hypothetical protein RL141_893 [Candidatus Parcubacteria bacterium]